MTSRTFACLAVFALILSSSSVAFAQQQAPEPTPSTPTTPTTPTNPGAGSGGTQQPGAQQPGAQQPGRSTFPTQQQQQQQQFPEMQRTFFFSGKVIMDDGTPPPEPVQIERVCGGNTKPEAWTDSKGRFSFQLGQNNSMMADASTSSSDGMFGGGGLRQQGIGGQPQISERDLMNCELRASLPGFRSDVYSLAGRRSLDSPDIGTLVMHRLAKVEGFTFSATSAYAPKDAKKSFDKGKELAKKKKFDLAQKELEKATSTYPKYAAAWFELGMVHTGLKNPAEARKAFEASIKADEKFINPYAQLTSIAAGEGKWEEALAFSNKVIKLNPFFSPQIYFINGVANLNMQKVDEAEESVREALKMDPNRRNPRSMALLGVILAQKQDFKGAAENLKAYLKAVPNASDAERIKSQIEGIEKEIAQREKGEGERQAQQ